MPINLKTAEPHVKLAAPQLPAGIRSGGENLPLDYPHLYQIQAGDWRISYAVEHNRLAILVLEVLNAAGESSKDAAREKLKRNMKVKLLDWPEGSGKREEVPAEVVANKMKIKWLPLEDETDSDGPDGADGKPHIKFMDEAVKPGELKRTVKGRITLVEDPGDAEAEDGADPGAVEGEIVEDAERKVTPLDEPTV